MHPRLAEFRILLRIFGEHLELLLYLNFRRRSRHLPADIVHTLLWALELLLISVVAELVMLLPMALYFHRATLFALPANAFSIPLVAILVPLALITFLLSLISPWLAAIPAAATGVSPPRHYRHHRPPQPCPDGRSPHPRSIRLHRRHCSRRVVCLLLSRPQFPQTSTHRRALSTAGRHSHPLARTDRPNSQHSRSHRHRCRSG